MNDVAPALKARVQKAFRDGLEQQAALKGLSEKNSPDYTDARAYGEAVGGELAEAFKQISGDDLPNGHMYYNIAEKVVVPLIDEAYAMAADYCEKTQNALNEKAGLGIKAVRPELDTERTESIVNKLDATEKFEDAKWILDDAVQNVVSSASDTSIKANAEAQYRAGLRPKVTRDSGGKCCDWCAALDGVYYYPDVPKEVYARHNNCTCSVEYSPSEGRRQDVWSKKWQGDAEPAAILSRAEAAKANEEARAVQYEAEKVERFREESHKGVDRDTEVRIGDIYSAGYGRRLELLGENKEVTRSLWDGIKEMLVHRSGTHFEDLMFVDAQTGQRIISKAGKMAGTCSPTRAMMDMLSARLPGMIIGVHNHPNSFIPSDADLATALERSYKYGLVCCHNGVLFRYEVARECNMIDAFGTLDVIAGMLAKGYPFSDVSVQEQLLQLKSSGVILEEL